ncbi:hypothetical protein ISALK_06360 [Isachenkonia alkalipeptolytica]|uniref:GIY-YIG domain-containing protein n=1 Tax=Isachenkonia alkalipeptolytica TaxID=2565777 RepID=A0AA43XJN0_9CLOT|nr:hypothetical protein [Isachenkonia alkalipeptolytica]
MLDLEKVSDVERDEFFIVAGTKYHEYLTPYIKNYHLPLKGKSLGNWIPELKRLIKDDEISSQGEELHRMFNEAVPLHWNEIDKLPYNNGIYIMFERGELYKGRNRIVRIGTHLRPDRLIKRLKNHSINKNANGSIFRKNIGRALLHKKEDPYLKIWDKNTSDKEIKEEYNHLIDKKKEKELEEIISDYLKNNITFVCFPVNTEKERLRLEEGMISVLNHTEDFQPSTSWLGLSSPVEEIKSSGLWNCNGLNGALLTDEEMKRIQWLFNSQSEEPGYPSKEPLIKTIDEPEKVVVVEENKSMKQKKKTDTKVTAHDIREYIEKLFDEARESGYPYLDLVSGDIHKQLNMKDSMPSVCSVMYQKIKDGDEILHRTPSGYSSTIKIRYFV